MLKNPNFKVYRQRISESQLNDPDMLAHLMAEALHEFITAHGDIAESTFVDVNTTGETRVGPEGQAELVFTYHIVITSGELVNG